MKTFKEYLGESKNKFILIKDTKIGKLNLKGGSEVQVKDYMTEPIGKDEIMVIDPLNDQTTIVSIQDFNKKIKTVLKKK